jgi:hypothetical protein
MIKIASDEVLKYWARLRFWTWEEAVSLSFGINPATFDFDYKRMMEDEPKLANAIQARLLALSRSYIDGQVQPEDFIGWAKEHDFEIPELLRQEISRLHNPSPTASAISNRINTLQKIVLGLAVGGYSYNDDSKRDTNIKTMLEDFKKAGVSIHEQTLRSALSDAWKKYGPG